MSWVNEFGLVSFGHTSERPNLDQTVGITENVTKIHEQFVALTYNADMSGTGGQMFYTLAARGSKDRNSMPNKETCTWPSYLFLRFDNGGVSSRVAKSTDNEMTTVRSCNKKLVDGKDHTLYLQWKNEGASADAADAAIYIYGWVDQTPAVGYDKADFIFKAVAGDAIAEGVLSHELFAEMWNETGAGWFSMDTYGNQMPYTDDHMRIKGLVIYDKNETEFGIDITPPTVDVDFNTSGIFATNEPITIPEATFAGAKEQRTYVILPDGTTVDVSGTATPTVAGTYTLIYYAKDDAGNIGYRSFVITVADRDNDAPELTLGSQENITVNVGETVVLPTATANDAKDGNLDAKISIEIIGTEHVTGLLPGANYAPMTAGVQTVIYRVSDSFGNVTEKSFTVTVKSTASGNMLSEPLVVGHPGKGMLNSQYVYDEKVSMLVHVEKDYVTMINLRGPVQNTEWPKGMVLRTADGGFWLSSNAHDTNIFGTYSWEFMKYIQGNDILLEYQVKNVVIDGVEYIRVQVWINGKVLKCSARAENGGYKNLEEGVEALYRKVSDFAANEKEVDNIYSSPVFVACYQGSWIIKELRMDGQSCTCPEDPKIPEGYEINFGSGHNFITGPVNIAGGAGSDYYQKLGQHSNEEYVAINFEGSQASKGALCLNLTGTATGWSGGLFTRLSKDGFEIRVSGPNSDPCAWLGGGVYSGGINDKEYTLVYKLTYITDAYGYSSAVQIEAWLGEAGGSLQKCLFAATNNSELMTTNEAKDATIISAKAFTSAENMTPGDITAVVLGDLNGDCAWTINKIETWATAPGGKVEGYENILNDKPANVLITEPVVIPADTDKVVKAAEDVNENYVAITFKHNSSGGHCLWVNMTGTNPDKGCWDGGIGCRIAEDGLYLLYDGANATTLAQTNFFAGSVAKDTEYIFVYKLTYLQANGKCYAVQIDMWLGQVGGEMEKIGLYQIRDDRCSYDAEKGAYIVKYNVAGTADQFTPDCSLATQGQWNRSAETTILNVQILSASPDVKGHKDIINDQPANVLITEPVIFPTATDTIVKAAENVNENYVAVTFKHNSPGNHCIAINMTGSVPSVWDGGVLLRLAEDGLYLCYGGVRHEIAQTNVYGWCLKQNVEYTLVYKLTYFETLGKYYAVQLEMWFGEAGGELKKVGLHEVKSEYCAYDAAKGAYIIQAGITGENAAQFAPDCTVATQGQWNAESQFTVVKVEILNAAP